MQKNELTNKTKVKICAVVTGANLSEFLENLKRIQFKADMVELRVDYIIDFKKADLVEIMARVTKESIITCRSNSKSGAGKFTGSLAQKIEILQTANDLGVNYIDIDAHEFEQVKLINIKAKLIISYHSWQVTESFSKIKKQLNSMRKQHADIIKIATMINSESDSKVLTRILLEKQENEKMIVLGMGPMGVFTRVLFPLLGSFLTFAAVGSSISAPGQLDLTELQMIYSSLGY